MKRLIPLIILGLAAGAVRADGGCRKKPSEFTIASFNLRCPGDKGNLEWRLRMPRCVVIVRRHGFDIFGVQEATPGQRKALDGYLPEFSSVGRGRNKDFGGEGMHIYYRKDRFECLEHGTFWLSETPDEPGSKYPGAACPRTCTWALFRDRVTAKSFRCFNTHLDHVSKKARFDAIKVIFERGLRQAKARGETVFLTGDFNSELDSGDSPEFLLKFDADRIAAAAKYNPIALVMTELVDTVSVSETPHAGPYRTLNLYTEKPRSRIDYVFATKNVRVLSHSTHDDRPEGQFASDHYPVSATVEIR